MYDVTVVIPVFNRVELLKRTLDGFFHHSHIGLKQRFIVVDDGSTEDVKSVLHTALPIEYIRLEREGCWKNPGRAMNVGLRLSDATVTIICHTGIIPATNVIEQVYHAVMREPSKAILGKVFEFAQETAGSQRPYFLLGGMLTEHFQRVRGYDEDFTEYGFEDDWLAHCLSLEGIQFEHRPEIHGDHVYHPREYSGQEIERMQKLYSNKLVQLAQGRITTISNLNREWGAIT